MADHEQWLVVSSRALPVEQRCPAMAALFKTGPELPSDVSGRLLSALLQAPP
jgi:hypothetical protein